MTPVAPVIATTRGRFMARSGCRSTWAPRRRLDLLRRLEDPEAGGLERARHGVDVRGAAADDHALARGVAAVRGLVPPDWIERLQRRASGLGDLRDPSEDARAERSRRERDAAPFLPGAQKLRREEEDLVRRDHADDAITIEHWKLPDAELLAL